MCVVDPQFSAYFDYFGGQPSQPACQPASRIEGIGRPHVEPSFVPTVIDRMIKVDDCWSLAAMLFLEKVLGRRYGASTGTNFMGVIEIVARMLESGTRGPVVTLLCDAGDRYASTYYNADWRSTMAEQLEQKLALIENFYYTGLWDSVCPSHDLPAPGTSDSLTR